MFFIFTKKMMFVKCMAKFRIPNCDDLIEKPEYSYVEDGSPTTPKGMEKIVGKGQDPTIELTPKARTERWSLWWA
jgi:hypothetical protein